MTRAGTVGYFLVVGAAWYWRVCWLLFSVSICCPIFAASERLARPTELGLLYDVLTREVSEKVHFRVHTEIREAAATEEEIAAMLTYQEQIMAEEEKHYSEAQRSEIREFRVKQLRADMSGTKRFEHELWRSGALYRLDQRNLDRPDELGDEMVNIGDLSFTNVPSFTINRDVGSANIQRDPELAHQELRLWDAATMGPELGLPCIVAFGGSRGDGEVATDWDGLRASTDADPARVQRLSRDEDPNWKVRVKEEDGGDPNRLVIELSGRIRIPSILRESVPGLRDRRILARYELDVGKEPRLLLGEVKDVGSSMEYRAIRSEFDDSGFPRRWEIRTVSGDDAKTRDVFHRFLHVDLNPAFNDREIFSPDFSDVTFVSEFDGEGVGTVLKNPDESLVGKGPVDGTDRSFRAWMIRFVICLAFVTPLVFYFKRNASGSGQRRS